jgi:hypothetical protein
MLGSNDLAGLLARVSTVGERLPTSSSLAVALMLFDVDPYSGGAAPDLHRVPFLYRMTREDEAHGTKLVYVNDRYRVPANAASRIMLARDRELRPLARNDVHAP